MKDIKELILAKIEKYGRVNASVIVKETGFSRAYVNRFFQELRNEGKIVLIGKANQASYIKAGKNELAKAKKLFTKAKKKYNNIGLSEDAILDQIKRETGIFLDLPVGTANIVSYAFTEILNNAIEHSRSKEIEISLKRDSAGILFEVVDRGVGIFKNIMAIKRLPSELEAIQDLLKGKQTTAPAAHSGEGIFFTSKAADMLIISSFTKKLIFNNKLEDIFIQDIKNFKGTKVIFSLALNTNKNLAAIFSEYSSGSYEFSKTRVNIKLFKMGNEYLSRSQARRVMNGLEKFKEIILDFKNITTIGQGFADEIFRIWQNHFPRIKITTKNSNENIDFMINRARER
ncbi:MAG: DUF4325 domain-containing protein [Patescibacteria group bacterium]|nr:DUF4325 domain-containing protein [Patescibacteria group bacterium]MDD4610606.1 DUF4325 domain-containing protein [Patescibacteria group bacterium]